MRKFWMIAGTLVLVGALSALAVGAVYAQADNPERPLGGFGRGRHGRGEAPGLGVMAVDEDAMHQALAEALGISVETFESEMDSGETLYTLALKYDVAFEDLRAVMDQAHAEALAEAVAQGTITQEQADWIQSRRGGGAGRGFGMGAGPHGGGYFGQGPCTSP
jgi:hypothetical protein